MSHVSGPTEPAGQSPAQHVSAHHVSGQHASGQHASGQSTGGETTGGEHARPVLDCGRLGEHPPHEWLTREDLWCPGTGEPGRTAPPDPNAEQKRKNKQKRAGNG